MADRERLPEPAEDDLLMCDIARQAHAVNVHALKVRAARAVERLLLAGMPLLMYLTHLGDHLRRPHGCT